VSHYGDRVHALHLDVTDPAAAQAAATEADEVFGRIDVAVNNAGPGDRVALEDATIEVFRQVANFLSRLQRVEYAPPSSP
jgi:NAD(P)-dependent dehydrogenase (short-subunit alcohol dehydrogenase family)